MATKDDEVIAVDDMPAEKVVEEPIVDDPQPDLEPEDKLYLGKFKTPEDMANSYSELESKYGEQGSKLKDTERENIVLSTKLEQTQIQPDPEPDNQPDFDAQLTEIERLIDEGELSVGEGMRRSAAISAEMSKMETANSIQMQQEQNIIETSRNAFLDQNPDFAELQKSGVLEEAKGRLPGFHDDVSAYYEYKAGQTALATEQAVAAAKEEGIKLGKAEYAKIAEGAEDTQKVLQTPGGDPAKKIERKQGSYSKNELRDSGMAALHAARSS